MGDMSSITSDFNDELDVSFNSSLLMTPYKLIIVIQSVEDIYSDEITICRPYLVVRIDDNEIGRTNNFLNATFTDIPILSLDETYVILNLFDEDTNNNNNVLGNIKFGLEALIANIPVQLTLPIENGLISNGFVKFTLLLKCNDSIVKVTVVDSPIPSWLPWEESDEVMEILSKIQLQFDIMSYAPVVKVLKSYSFILTRVKNSEYIINDVVNDISSILRPLNSSSVNNILSNINSSVVVRRSKTLNLSTNIEFNNMNPIKYYKIFPLPYIGLKFISIDPISSAKSYISIDIGNKFVSWSLLRWIQVCLCHWNNDSQLLPAWISGGKSSEYKLKAIVSTYKDYGTSDYSSYESLNCTWTSFLVVALDTNYKLLAYDFETNALIKSLDISNLNDIQISIDSTPPSNEMLSLDLLSCVNNQIHDKSLSIRATEVAKNSRSHVNLLEDLGGPKGFSDFVSKSLSSTADSFKKSTISVKKSAKNAAKGVVSTTINAAKLISHVSPTAVIVSAKQKMKGVGKDLQKVLSRNDISFNKKKGQSVTYVISRFGKYRNIAFIPTSLSSYWDSQILVDLDHAWDSDYSHFNTKNEVGNMNDDRDNELIDFYLYHGIAGSEELVCQRSTKLSNIISKCSNTNCKSNLTVDDTSSRATNSFYKLPNEMKLTFHSEIGLFISVFDGRNIMSAKSSGNMYIRFKFADIKGKAINNNIKDVPKTSIIACSNNPDWGGRDSIYLKASEGLDRTYYVRLQILGGSSMNPDTLGYILIPVTDFKDKPEYKVYPVMKFKKLTGVGGSGGIYGLGELRVKIQKVVEKTIVSPSSPVQLPYLKLIPSIKIHNVFKTMYPADILLSGCLDVATEETFYITISSSDDLILVDMDTITCIEENNFRYQNSSINEKKLSTSSSLSKRLDFVDAKNSRSNHLNDQFQNNTSSLFLEFVIFENQRRQVLPPYEFSSNNLFPVDRKMFSDESGRRNFDFVSLSQVPPPQGYEWAGNWVIDRVHTQTDEFGWSYGLNFKDLTKNLKLGNSTTNSSLRSVRRRKWTRNAKCIDLSYHVSNKAKSKRNVTSKRRLSTFRHNTPAVVVVQSNFEENSEFAASPSTSTRKSYSVPALAEEDDNWRYDEYLENSNNIMSTCQERKSIDSPICIPWAQVICANMITPGVLSIFMKVNRYFGRETTVNSNLHNFDVSADHRMNNSGDIFREVLVEVFICSCPANELKIAIEERIEFNRFRVKVKDVIKSGNVNGTNDNTSIFKNIIGSDDDVKSATYYSKDNNDNDFTNLVAPDTVELSLGSETVAVLDKDAEILENKAKLLYIEELNSNIHDHELDAYALRAFRLRLYIACLLSSHLKIPNFNFNEDDTNLFIEHDIISLNRIVQEDEISTVNNRLEYLLDIAEHRLSDLAVCGWHHQLNKNLEKVIELFTNRYLFEMVQLLAKFFTTKTMQKIRGLQTKITLISTFTSHNDRLTVIIDKLFKFYNIIIDPKPNMSLYLDFNNLMSWYAIVLQQDMKKIVDNALSVWSNVETDASGRASKYHTPLPWYPMQFEINSQQNYSNIVSNKIDTGIFMTLLPEDTINYLSKYLQFARLRKEEMTGSLIDSIDKIDGKIAISYSNAFHLLAEAYWKNLTSKNWNIILSILINTNLNQSNSNTAGKSLKSGVPFNGTTVTTVSKYEEELLECCDWLCSVANDSRRVIDNAMIDEQLSSFSLSDRAKFGNTANNSVDGSVAPMNETINIPVNAECNVKVIKRNSIIANATGYPAEVGSIVNHAYLIFSRCLYRCLDYISCYIFYDLSSFSNHTFFNDQFYLVWENDAKDINNNDDFDENIYEKGNVNMNSTKSRLSIISTYLLNLNDLLLSKCDFLDDRCIFELLCVCIDKVIIRFFYLLRDLFLAKRKYSFSSVEINQFVSDVSFTRKMFSDIVDVTHIDAYKDAISSKFKRLEQVVILLMSSCSDEETLQSLLKIASSRPSEAKALANLIRVCYDITNISKNSLLNENHNTKSTFDEVIDKINEFSEILSPEEYRDILLNASSDVSPEAKVFLLTEIMEDMSASSTSNNLNMYVFNIYTFILDSVHFNIVVDNHSNSTSYLSSFFSSSTSKNNINNNISNNLSTNNIINKLNVNLIKPTSSTLSLTLNKLKAFNIFNLDSNKKPATYVVIELLGDVEKFSYQTKVKYDTIDPDWCNEDPDINIGISSPHISSQRLLITVYYKNYFYKDEIIGICNFELLQLYMSNIEVKEFNLCESAECSKRVKLSYKNALNKELPIPKLKFNVRLNST